MNVSPGGCHGVVVVERHPAGQHPVQDHSQRVDVGGGADLAPGGLLGGEVGGSADERGGTGQVGAIPTHPGNAEVGELGLPVGGEQDVARGDVAMDDTPLVGMGQRRRRGGSNGGRLLGRKAPVPAESVRQRDSGGVLHHQVRPLLVAAGVVHGDHVGMAQRGGGERLPGEALCHGFLGGEMGMEALDGHLPPQAAVTSQQHRGHASGTERANGLVAVVYEIHGINESGSGTTSPQEA